MILSGHKRGICNLLPFVLFVPYESKDSVSIEQ